jgi:hypothetical protein
MSRQRTGTPRFAGVLGVVGAVVAVAAGVSCAGSGGESHDALREHDVQVAGRGGAGSSQGYEYVAKRPLAVVALAEARGLDGVVARAAMDRLADALDTCATEQARKGGPADGAARIVAQIEPSGTVGGTSLKVDPGSGVAEGAVLCIVAPLRMLTFPATDAGARGLAIEALWGKVVPGK